MTSLASRAAKINAFVTGMLGWHRAKKTINFDAPDACHIYYGDESGAAAIRSPAGFGPVKHRTAAFPPFPSRPAAKTRQIRNRMPGE